MSTIALKVLELVKSLPPADQQMISAELARSVAQRQRTSGQKPQKLDDGTYYSPGGIPDDDAFFKIMERQDAARSQDPAPPAPELE